MQLRHGRQAGTGTASQPGSGTALSAAVDVAAMAKGKSTATLPPCFHLFLECVCSIFYSSTNKVIPNSTLPSCNFEDYVSFVF